MRLNYQPGEHDVLLVIDLQNDYCAGGTLAIPGADALVPQINHLARRFAHVLLTQDWHPHGHLSFASSHPGRSPYEQIVVANGLQTLWPDHCVQDTHGAALHPQLAIAHAELILRKGYRLGIDSHSAFYENDRRTPTGLAGYLRERGLRRLFLSGLATDYCVYYSAMDARRENFEVILLQEACQAIDQNGSLEMALQDMRMAGVDLS